MIEKVTSSKNDLPAAPANERNGILQAGATPADFTEIKAMLAKAGGKIKHAGGALPPLFPQKGIRQGDARLVTYLGAEVVPAERAGGGNPFVVLNFEVHDHTKPNFPIGWRAQMPLATVLEKYFQGNEVGSLDDKADLGLIKALGFASQEKLLAACGDDEEFVVPTRLATETPMLLITYGGEMEAKGQKNGAKRWIVEEFTPAKN